MACDHGAPANPQSEMHLGPQRPEASEVRDLGARDLGGQRPQRPETSEARDFGGQRSRRPEASEVRPQRPENSEASDLGGQRSRRAETSEARYLGADWIRLVK
jgi:hypothetical protein